MMVTLFIVLHVSVCFIMIGVVLLQAGKGAEIGAAFGGSSQTIFGSRGPGTFLSKMTVGAAVIFMVTSLVLSVMSGGQSVASKIKVPPADEIPFTTTPTSTGSEVPPLLPPGATGGGAQPEETAPASPTEPDIP